MLLSIDRVLKLLAEGKSLEKIAELAHCAVSDVAAVVEEASELIKRHEKPIGRKKIIIKKAADSQETPEEEKGPDSIEVNDFIAGAELSSIPLNSVLTMYVDGASSGNPGPAGIGVVIIDQEGRQIGKISSYIGRRTNNFAEYTALIRALKIALYFKARVLKIRTDSELVVKQMNGEYKVKNEQIKKLYDQATALKNRIKTVKIEHVSRNQNDKADYLAKKASEYR